MTIQIPRETYDKFVCVFPWGVRGKFISRLIELAMVKIGKGGDIMIGAIMRGDFDPIEGKVVAKGEK